MVRPWPLVTLLFTLAFTPACERLPAYNETVTVTENGDAWDARLLRSFHSDRVVMAELEYANRTGATFSVKPENVVVYDDDGNRWIADGRTMLIPLLQPGETKKVRASFSNVLVTTKRLRLYPFNKLAHANPVILLKAEGGEPLPGNHTSPAWDKAE